MKNYQMKKPVKNYNGFYNLQLGLDKKTYTHGVFGLKEGKLHYTEHLKTYPTHRMYAVVVYKGNKGFSNYEKTFFRDYTYSLLTSEHDFSKSFRKQVSDFFNNTTEGTTRGEDGKLLYTYKVVLKKPVKLKLDKFNSLFYSTRGWYKHLGVNGKNMNMGTSTTKLRTKEDSHFYERFNEGFKMVA